MTLLDKIREAIRNYDFDKAWTLCGDNAELRSLAIAYLDIAFA